MSQILNKVRDVDPNNSDAVKDALSGFFQNLPKHTQTSSSIWLKVLENVINRFPKYCMSHRNTIETFLAHFLDSKSYHIVIEAAKCGHALQQVRPSQEKTATPKVSWREHTELLCNAAHALIGEIFTNDVYKNGGNYYQKSDSESILANTPLSKALAEISDLSGGTQSSDVDDKKSLLSVRLHNVFVFIQAMLVEPYPVAKPVRPQAILDVILRALTVFGGSNHGAVDDVCRVKIQALRSLDALAMCLGPNLIPFSPLVFRMAMQTLRWSSENPSEASRAVRCHAYGSLSNWLSTLGSHLPEGGRREVRGRSLPDELAAAIARDVTPPRHLVQLTMSTQPTKNLSKKAKRKLAKTMLQESNMAARMPGEKNKTTVSEKATEDVAIAALDCAEVFLTVCGIFLKPAIHKLLQELLVRECYRIADYEPARALALLRTLEAARRGAPNTSPPPTQHCLRLYSALRGSTHRGISQLASQALLDIRLHIHGSPPSLHFAVEPQKDSMQETRDRRNEISEMNRAALEELLGADRMKSIAEKSEVITIPDEPSSKKPRLNLEDDKISISSQSTEVVTEDSDDDDEDEEIIFAETIIDDDKAAEEDFVKPFEKDTTDCSRSEDVKLQESQKQKSIHEATTQLPINVNISGDTIDGPESPLSVEVAYDYPSTGKSTVAVLEKMEEDNLPSSTETDDIQITCGQQVKSSQDVSQKKVDENEVKEAEAKVDSSNEKLTNGDSNDKLESSVTVKISEGVNVEEMLADFVDEVNDDVICVDS